MILGTLTVEELIEQLQKLPKNAPIKVKIDDYDTYSIDGTDYYDGTVYILG